MALFGEVTPAPSSEVIALSYCKWGAFLGYDTGCIDLWSGLPYGLLLATSPTASTCPLSGHDPSSNGSSAVPVALSTTTVCFFLSG